MSGGEKGYVQFHCRWEPAAPPAGPEVEALRAWRERLRALGVIGAYPDGVGYGNLSHRAPAGEGFLVSGTRTGHLAALGPEHFTRVVACDVERNWLHCRGPVQASSESLSHAAAYRADPAIRCVVHVHHPDLWRTLRGRAPTTDPAAEAGTPAMARAVERLLREAATRAEGLLVMGGHPEGLLSVGTSADEAGERIVAALQGLAG